MSLTWSRERPPTPGARTASRGPRRAARKAARSEPIAERVPLPTLREAWLSLENRFESLLPVQTWDHQSAWWSHFRRGRIGRTWVVRDPDGAVVGIVPLYIQERRFRLGTARVLAPVGHGEPVRTGRIDALAAPKREGEVARLVADALLRDPSWDFADWPDVPEGGVLERIARAMRTGGRVELRTEVRSAGPRISLPESFESFLAEMPDSTRRKVLTLRARISDHLGARWASAGTDLDVDSALRLAGELGRGADVHAPSARPARPDAVAAFRRELIRRGVPRGRIALRVLFARGLPVAALCGTTLGSTFHAERSGFVESVPVFGRAPVTPAGDRPHAESTREARDGLTLQNEYGDSAAGDHLDTVNAIGSPDAPGGAAHPDGPVDGPRAGSGRGAHRAAGEPAGPFDAGAAADASSAPASGPAVPVEPVSRDELQRFATLDVLERAIAARLDAVDFAAADGGWDVAWCEIAPPVVSMQVIRRGLAQRMAWFRAGLSESPRHVLRFVVGRERFDELESAWRDMRRTLRPRPD